MRGLGWIRRIRQDEAQQMRDRIALLECELIIAASSRGKSNLLNAGHELRSQKARLERLEHCIASMSKRP
ncbi:hypothetical protein EN828_26110 [Mesorhizobium sp. M2D.F.Ca.ET.185.01.1.1]|nr:hypothetical protein EJ071_34785 [Mesorhizobium sp. M1B.F.Ca.ET.045.04.1.1]RUW41923.1 hypothetical protein EOA37_07550 [Mesorhizobium sp. M2A.F.Ca.ET.015.02.1.1]RUW50607.1 hypothetical protein EOA36_16260 [Mesorhizobium sp. M8A.F.Ca.ET.021.01.1.1]RVC93780.1 hypothetical protein EN739_19920 [Mesorhizobium sp. M2A.F.Ca.ET.017.03.2.1]RVD07889.1 hypothetical protein EN753_16230 [Mesorhizobium sp. M2A.F.Ca.ET.029.05.1.1]RVD41351.1 hypothetical protein EN741_14580 [Mesorhizobium sp. M4B.F.Ca.ET.0